MDTHTDPELRLSNQLCFAVYACSREIIKLYHPLLKKLGLTYTQYITMLVLWEHPVISAKDLGNALYLDSGTLTPLLKKLESIGLIERRRSAEDERSLTVTLTQKGESLKEAARDIPSQLACGMQIPAHEAVFLRERLKDLIRQIHTCGD